MGIMDKVKAQAEQAMAKAQQGMSQGQAKLDTMQAKRGGDALLRELGAAYYASQRTGGPQEAVGSALAAIDAHVAANGPLDVTPSPDPSLGTTTFQPSGPSAPGAAGAPAAPPEGASFKLEDL